MASHLTDQNPRDHADYTDRSDRSAAIAGGIFFIIATAFLFLGEMIYKPILSAPDFLDQAARQKPRIVFGLLIEFLCIIAIPMVAIALYPVLKRINESVALAYVFFRALEAIILITIALHNKLALISLSERFMESGATDPDRYLTIAEGFAAQNLWGDTSGLLYNLVFCIGALVLYTVLLRSRLIPRWISIWGILAILTLLGVVVAVIFVDIPPVLGAVLLLPIGVQEMVMAVWFIWRGFDTRALTAG